MPHAGQPFGPRTGVIQGGGFPNAIPPAGRQGEVSFRFVDPNSGTILGNVYVVGMDVMLLDMAGDTRTRLQITGRVRSHDTPNDIPDIEVPPGGVRVIGAPAAMPARPGEERMIGTRAFDVAWCVFRKLGFATLEEFFLHPVTSRFFAAAAAAGGLGALLATPVMALPGAVVAAAGVVAATFGLTLGGILDCFRSPPPPVTMQEVEQELRRRRLEQERRQREEAERLRRTARDDDDEEDDDDDNGNGNGGNGNGGNGNGGFAFVGNPTSSAWGNNLRMAAAAGTLRMAMGISQAAALRGIRITPAQAIQLLQHQQAMMALRQQAMRTPRPPFGTV